MIVGGESDRWENKRSTTRARELLGIREQEHDGRRARGERTGHHIGKDVPDRQAYAIHIQYLPKGRAHICTFAAEHSSRGSRVLIYAGYARSISKNR
jgi:hypothetical protein